MLPDVETLFLSALHSYKEGVLHVHKPSILEGLNFLIQIQESQPSFFENGPKGFHLWGNLLIALGMQTGEECFFEQGIAFYERVKDDPLLAKEVQWDIAEAYFLLGKRSHEPADFKKAFEAYKAVSLLDQNAPHFWIDYGECAYFYGFLTAEPSFIKEAIPLFKKIIVDQTPIEDKLQAEQPAAYLRAWLLYAHSVKALVELSGEMRDFFEAEAVFMQAIANCPQEAALSHLFGELCVRFGYLKKDPYFLEKGIDKLDGNSPLFIEALLKLGLLLDDFRLLKEGKRRAELFTRDGFLSSLVSFAWGSYFSDTEMLIKAVFQFEEMLLATAQNIDCRQMLYEATISLFELTKEPLWLEKALKAISTLTELRPDTSAFYYEWAIALLKQHTTERKHPLTLELAIEKFKVALSKGEDLPGLFHYAIALDLLGEEMQDKGAIEAATQILEDIYEKMPSSSAVRLQLGIAYFHNGDEKHLRAAVELFESILQEEAEEEKAWHCLAKTLQALSELVGDEDYKKRAHAAQTRAKAGGLYG